MKLIFQKQKPNIMQIKQCYSLIIKGNLENSAVGGYRKIADKFVARFLTKENESMEEAHVRLAAGQKAREDASAEERRKREEEKKVIL